MTFPYPITPTVEQLAVADVEYIDDGGSASGATTFNITIFGNVTSKHCAIGITGRGSSSRTLDSMSIASQSCGEVDHASGGPLFSSQNTAGLWVTDALVSFSISTTLSVTFSGSVQRICVGVAAMGGVSNVAEATNTSVGANPANIDLTGITAGGVVVGCAHECGNQSSSYDWSASSAEITDHGDIIFNGRVLSMATGIAAGTSVTLRADSDNPNLEFGTSAIFPLAA